MEELTDQQRQDLEKLFQTVLDPVTAGYLDEAKRCVAAGAYRAAIVMAWCGLIYHLHQQVDIAGLDNFERVFNELQDAQKQKKDEIKRTSDLQKIKDYDLLRVLLNMGLLKTEEELETLDEIRELRNKCAHAGPRDIEPDDVLYRFKKIEPFVSESQGTRCSFQDYREVVDFVVNSAYSLHAARVRALVKSIREQDLLPCVDRLLDAYFADDTTDEVRKRIRSFWERLEPTPQKCRQINRKIAQKLARVERIDTISTRQLIFWAQLDEINENDRIRIIADLLPEFQGVVANGLTTPAELDLLRKILNSDLDAETRQDYELVFTRARKQIEQDSEFKP